MAARTLRPRHQEDIKAKIKVSMIINRLQDNLEGKIELTPSQIQSARILLDKTMSNAPTDTNMNLAATLEVVELRRYADKPSK